MASFQKLSASLNVISAPKARMAILPEPRWLPLANDAAGENTPTTPELPLTLDVKIACPVRFPQPLVRV